MHFTLRNIQSNISEILTFHSSHCEPLPQWHHDFLLKHTWTSMQQIIQMTHNHALKLIISDQIEQGVVEPRLHTAKFLQLRHKRQMETSSSIIQAIQTFLQLPHIWITCRSFHRWYYKNVTIRRVSLKKSRFYICRLNLPTFWCCDRHSKTNDRLTNCWRVNSHTFMLLTAFCYKSCSYFLTFVSQDPPGGNTWLAVIWNLFKHFKLFQLVKLFKFGSSTLILFMQSSRHMHCINWSIKQCPYQWILFYFYLDIIILHNHKLLFFNCSRLGLIRWRP